MQRVMVFGVFDGLHDGHRAFLRAARDEGDHVTVALAHDHIVHLLKGHLPEWKFDERAAAIMMEGLADEVIAGDETLGEYATVRRYHPHVIALGYDQEDLRKDIAPYLESFPWEIAVKVMPPHKPEKLHSRLLNK